MNRKYLAAAGCFLMVFVTLGFCSSPKSLYLAAISQATGIPRSLYSLSDTSRHITSAVISLFFGNLIGRFGSKKLIAAGFFSLILFSLISSRASAAAGFCLGGFFLGLGLSWTTTTMVGHIVNQWFPEHRGTVMGLILAANGIGGAAAVQIISPIINRENDPFGYRSAYLLTALILAVSGAIILFIFRITSSDKPQRAAAAAKTTSSDPEQEGISWEKARRSRFFYCAALAVFLTGMILQAVNGVSAAHMRDVGLPPELIAGIFSFYSIALAGCKVLCGFLYDRLGLRRLLLICETAAVAAIGMLIITAPTQSGKTAAMIYGILSAMAMPLETVMLPLITTDLFGECSYEKMLGIMVSANTAGYALSTPLINLCYDTLGTYIPAFITLVILMILAAALFLSALRDADKTKKQIPDII